MQKAKNNILFSIARHEADIQDRNDLLVNMLNVHDNIVHFVERIQNTTKVEVIKLIDEIFIKQPWKIVYLKSLRL